MTRPEEMGVEALGTYLARMKFRARVCKRIAARAAAAGRADRAKAARGLEAWNEHRVDLASRELIRKLRTAYA